MFKCSAIRCGNSLDPTGDNHILKQHHNYYENLPLLAISFHSSTSNSSTVQDLK